MRTKGGKMIRSAIKKATAPITGSRRKSPIRYDMFNHDHTNAELKAAQLLERIYHKGQEKAWDGKTVLHELLEKHSEGNLVELPSREGYVGLRVFFLSQTSTVFFSTLARAFVALRGRSACPQ